MTRQVALNGCTALEHMSVADFNSTIWIQVFRKFYIRITHKKAVSWTQNKTEPNVELYNSQVNLWGYCVGPWF